MQNERRKTGRIRYAIGRSTKKESKKGNTEDNHCPNGGKGQQANTELNTKKAAQNKPPKITAHHYLLFLLRPLRVSSSALLYFSFSFFFRFPSRATPTCLRSYIIRHYSCFLCQHACFLRLVLLSLFFLSFALTVFLSFLFLLPFSTSVGALFLSPPLLPLPLVLCRSLFALFSK